MKTFKDTSMLFLVAALLSAVWTGMCVADDFPSLELRLETQRQELLPGESVIITLEITNTGTKDARRWAYIAPGSRREFKFTWSDAQGRKIETRVAEGGGRPEMDPLKPGESYISRINLVEAFHFFYGTRPGKYALWVEYIPERQWKDTETPVLAKSNVLTFHVEPLDIVAVKSVETEFLDLGYDTPRKKKTTFEVFVHKGSKSYRLYWKKTAFSPFLISDNVIPEMFDMKVDGYGNTHVWYQTTDGAFYRYIRRNSTNRPPEDPERGKVYPYPRFVPPLKENETERLDLPNNYMPQFKFVKGKVWIDFVPPPRPDTDGEEPRLHPPVRVPPPSPFPWYLIIIGVVVVVGAIAAVSAIHFRRKR